MKAFGAVIFFLILLIGSAATSTAEESISISCYVFDRYLGSVVVFDARAAANACNSFYRDCRGQCSGCFQDYDYVRDVCISANGQTYLRN